MRRSLLHWTVAVALTVLVLEAVLRVAQAWIPALDPVSPQRPDESLFWVKSHALGWELAADVSGHYSNGRFDGRVTIGAGGFRQNAVEDTYVQGYRDVFFIGDSTTASFEVDDDETVPALLEQRWRARGARVNVLNLGIRGYGTDQAVLRALRYAERFPPSDIIYMHTANDIADSNKLGRPRASFRKGVYIREAGAGQFRALDYPVPETGGDYVGYVVLDQACRPVVVNARARPAQAAAAGNRQSRRWWRRIKGTLLRHSYIARAAQFAGHRLGEVRAARRQRSLDPYTYLNRADVDLGRLGWPALADLESAYYDDGGLRNRCRDYFDDQMAFLLGMLRSIPSVRNIHVVQFPSERSMALLTGAGSANHALFERLKADGTIDQHIDLSLAALQLGGSPGLARLRCLGDGHFCEEGNRWIAAVIDAALDRHPPSPISVGHPEPAPALRR